MSLKTINIESKITITGLDRYTLRELLDAIVSEAMARPADFKPDETEICWNMTDPTVIWLTKVLNREIDNRGLKHLLTPPAPPKPKFTTADLDDVEKACAESGRMIQAIKLFRTRLGSDKVGLKEAKDLVDAYRAEWRAAHPTVAAAQDADKKPYF